MSQDICCVINAHREGNVLYPTIASVKRAVNYAQECGLKADIHVILDNSDEKTTALVKRACADTAVMHEVAFKDLAHSRNYAVANSTGRYMAFVDGDDLWSKTWLVDSYVMAERSESVVVLHPEYNIFFGDENSHVFNHVDMDAQDFEFESLYRMNYWTALSFARTDTYLSHPYRKNSIMDGFGYEDWTWNFETISDGIKHKVVPGTVHFIRKGRAQDSLLAQTNQVNAIPRIFDIYRVPEVLENQAPLLTAGEDQQVEEVDDAQGPESASNESNHSATRAIDAAIETGMEDENNNIDVVLKASNVSG